MSRATDLYTDPRADTRAKKKGFPVWGIVLIVLGVLMLPVLAIVAVLVMGFAFTAGADEIEPSAADRAAILNVDVINECWGHDGDPALETLTKLRYPDGTLGIAYEFEDDDLYLYTSIDVERTTRDARATYAGMSAFSQLGLLGADDGLEFEKRNELFSWGDKSQFWVIEYEGEECGYVAAALRGTHILYVTWSGFVFERGDGASIADFLVPELERMADYEITDS